VHAIFFVNLRENAKMVRANSRTRSAISSLYPIPTAPSLCGQRLGLTRCAPASAGSQRPPACPVSWVPRL